MSARTSADDLATPAPVLTQPLNAEQAAACLTGSGLVLDVGLARIRVRAPLPWPAAAQIAAAYRHFGADAPAAGTAGTPNTAHGPPRWADLHLDLRPGLGLRRWFRPQVRLLADGLPAFEPFPGEQVLPLLEWGANWLIGRRMNDVLLLHAGTLARDGRALLMPALPGSGKSTLTAALVTRGWRLLSDEFGACDPATGLMRPCVKPVALKNASIDVIRRFAPTAELGPSFAGTRKGTVAHLAPPAASVAARHEPAAPALLVIPRWQAGSRTTLERITPESAFTSLAFNAFNYTVLGATGFRTVLGLVRRMALWRLVYSDLEDATQRLDALWSQLRPETPAAEPLAHAGAGAPDAG